MPIDSPPDTAPVRDAFSTDAFISYANQDAAVAEALCASLERAGLVCWIAPRDVRPGALYADAIVRAINGARVVVLVLSQYSIASPHVGKEIERASSKQRPILALRIDAAPLTPALEYFLSESQWVEAPGQGREPAFAKVAQAIRHVLEAGGLAGGPPMRPVAGDLGPAAGGSAAARADVAAVDAGRHGRGGRRRVVGVGAAAALAAALVAAGMYLWLHASAPSPKRVAAAGGAAATPGDAAAGSALAAPDAAMPSVAVLPFEDLSEKRDQAYFSDGLSIELIGQLGQVTGLRVPARVSSFYFKGKQASLADIAHSLNVDHILEGTVSTSGRNVRITTDLVSVSTGSAVWSERYDRKLDDLFKVQDDIAQSVVKALKVALLDRHLPRAPSATNPAAYTAFLRCQEDLLVENRENVGKAIRNCQESVDLDPNFAPAWVGLSHAARVQFVGFSGPSYAEARALAYGAAERAAKLDPKSADALYAMALVLYQMDFDPTAAAAKLEQAKALDPASTDAAWLFGYIASVQCRYADAERAFAETLRRNPLFGEIYVQLGNVHYRAGDLAAARSAYQQALALDPRTGSVHYRLGLVALLQGDPAAALAEFEREPDPDFHAVGLPMAYDALGRRAEADRARAAAEASAAAGASYQIALVYAARHDTDRTFEWLDRAYRQRDAGMLWIKGEPWLKPLRTDARFAALLHEMHLD